MTERRICPLTTHETRHMHEDHYLDAIPNLIKRTNKTLLTLFQVVSVIVLASIIGCVLGTLLAHLV